MLWMRLPVYTTAVMRKEIVKSRPRAVTGEMSPYPTVVTVMHACTGGGRNERKGDVIVAAAASGTRGQPSEGHCIMLRTQYIEFQEV
jgi:hypothetical protein